jgi:prepilin-type N-terminal cleavage/methylation domain-containing protein
VTAGGRRKARVRAGFTLIEVLISVTLVGLLSGGMMVAMHVGLNAMKKADTKLMRNRRVAGAQRILEQQVAGIMPIAADCLANPSAAPARFLFFQGEAQSMRFASTYSLQQAARGGSMVLEFQVISGEDGQGVRLIVNEFLYTGPRGAGASCLGLAPDPLFGGMAPQFLPIQPGAASFVLADKLAACRFSFRDPLPIERPPQWVVRWTKRYLPDAIRVEMDPLAPDPSRLQPLTLTMPIHVTRLPLEPYDNN